eukprot:403364280
MGQCVSQGKNKRDLQKKNQDGQFKPEKQKHGKKKNKDHSEDSLNSQGGHDSKEAAESNSNSHFENQQQRLLDDNLQSVNRNDISGMVKFQRERRVSNFDGTQSQELLMPKGFQMRHLNDSQSNMTVDSKNLQEKLDKLPLLPEDMKSQLLESCISGDITTLDNICSRYRFDVQSIVGKMEQIKVGNKTIQSENLNILHLAAYHSQLEVVKYLCENIPSMDLTQAGKIPSSSGLANQSEISSYHEYETSSRINIRASNLSIDMHGLNQNSQRRSIANFDRVGPNQRVRSLILFWAIDRQDYKMLNYLWNFNLFGQTNWGIKNLEFMLILANDLQDSTVFEILLSPKPFSIALNNLTFVMAMDFIDDHIVRNGFIAEELKLRLIYSNEMAPYSFVGALIHYTLLAQEQLDDEQLRVNGSNQKRQSSQQLIEDSDINSQRSNSQKQVLLSRRLSTKPKNLSSDFDRQVDECEEDIEIEELLDLFHKLTEKDVKFISNSSEIIEKITETQVQMKDYKRISSQHKQTINSMLNFIVSYRQKN